LFLTVLIATRRLHAPTGFYDLQRNYSQFTLAND
jgi:hypothetical protein